MKLSIVNKVLVVDGMLTLLTGIWLHAGYERMLKHPGLEKLWLWLHIVFAALLIIVACVHAAKNNWWFKSLKFKINKTRQLWQRIATPAVVLLFLSLVATGLCMLCGWYGQHSHIWIWHFYLGLIWAAVAISHAIAFHRKKAAANATK